MATSKILHVIWDWNGTLFDDAWLCREVVNRMLASYGKAVLTEERYQEVFDFPVQEYYRRAGFDFSSVPYAVLAAEFMGEYERRRSECRLRDGARETLQRIADSGITQSILSAYAKDSLEDVVSSLGIRHMFTGLYGLDNFYAAGKTEIGLRMMAQAAHEPSSTILIGDTTHDHDVAAAIGVRCILMPGGHHSKRRLEQTGSVTVDSLSKLGSDLDNSLNLLA